LFVSFMDHLSLLLQRFSITAGVFYAGPLCGVHAFDRGPTHGHVHLVRRGPVQLTGASHAVTSIDEPTLVFMPRPDAHKLVADEREGADVVCANIRLGAGGRNPITDCLPATVMVPLAELPGVQALLSLLDDEAFTPRAGRQAALDLLCELLMIRMLRHCMARGLTTGGTLAGLADARLSKTLVALHDQPAHDWSLEDMAERAGMSRARFAAHFKQVLGITPADYLAVWRMTVAQGLLKAGRPLKHVALEVGYGSTTAFARVFQRKVGVLPSVWVKADSTPLPPGCR